MDTYSQHIPIRGAISEMGLEPDPMIREAVGNIITSAAMQQGDGKTGLITAGDLVHGAIYAGLGARFGGVVGSVMGTIFGMPASQRRYLIGAGAVGGAIKGLYMDKISSDMTKKAVGLMPALAAAAILPFVLGIKLPDAKSKATLDELSSTTILKEYQRAAEQLKLQRELKQKGLQEHVTS